MRGIDLSAQSDLQLESKPVIKSLAFKTNELAPVKVSYSKDDLFHQQVNYPALGGVSLAYSYALYSINNYYSNTWWRAEATEFKIVNDWEYALWLDKIGHAYGTAVISHFFSAGFQAANVDYEISTWLGALGGLGMQLYVEIQDGYGPNWGFSPGDAVFDFLGASYFVANYYYPYLDNFQLRVSYYPSKAFLNGEKPDKNISDDYEGQKLWLAFKMKKLLPESLSKHWPSFLMISAGYFVSGIGEYVDSRDLEPSFYLAFDIDASEIPLHGRFWELIKNTLNYIHFPLPGIRVNKNGVSLMLIAY